MYHHHVRPHRISESIGYATHINSVAFLKMYFATKNISKCFFTFEKRNHTFVLGYKESNTLFFHFHMKIDLTQEKIFPQTISFWVQMIKRPYTSG